VDVQYLVTQVPNLINNLEIYEQSQLTVVTESHFNQTGGLFITEKTFRPLLVGHPFMVLGQKGTLKKLRSWGFQTDFDGLDQSYDDVIDDSERFLHFHQSLKNWYYTPLEEKKYAIENRRLYIAGNESFKQGPISTSAACELAAQKQVLVSTIFCGDRLQGINLGWKAGADCAKGDFFNIDPNQTVQQIETPFDDQIIEQNKVIKKNSSVHRRLRNLI
jgi:hypothetical protein